MSWLVLIVARASHEFGCQFDGPTFSKKREAPECDPEAPVALVSAAKHQLYDESVLVSTPRKLSVTLRSSFQTRKGTPDSNISILYIYIYIYIYIYLHLPISIYIYLYLSICLSVYLSIYLSVYLSLLSIYPSIHLSIYPSMEGSQKILSLPALPTGIRKQDRLTKIVENVAT